MKRFIMLFCVLICSNYVSAQSDCSAYHRGYFMYTDSVGDIILIHRKNKFQYELNRKTKVRTQFALNWTNDCEYTITQTLTNSKSLKKHKNRVNGFRITKADGDNGYYYGCCCDDEIAKRKEVFLKKITKQQFYELY